MKRRIPWISISLLTVLFSFSALAAESGSSGSKGVSFSGSFEGGYQYFWNNNLKASQFFVDGLDVTMQGKVADKTRVVVESAAAVFNPGMNGLAGIAANMLNTSAYDSSAKISANDLDLSLLNIYMEHQCTENVSFGAGYFAMPFGMESMQARYDMPTYYYSAAFARSAGLGWLHDAGLRSDIKMGGAGKLEVAFVDGRTETNSILATRSITTPSLGARWSMEHKMGDMSITPVVSTHLGRWHGFAEDIGLSAGANFKMGKMWANAEFVMDRASGVVTGFDTSNSTFYSVYAEPGMSFGPIDASVKLEYDNDSETSTGATSATGWAFSAAISHTYSKQMRVRLAFSHDVYNSTVQWNDIRLLWGASF